MVKDSHLIDLTINLTFSDQTDTTSDPVIEKILL